MQEAERKTWDWVSRKSVHIACRISSCAEIVRKIKKYSHMVSQTYREAM